MFLGNNNLKFYRNQIVAEIKKELDLLLEKSRTDLSSKVPVEVFFQNLCLEKTTNTKEAKNQISKKNHIIWFLYGERYVLPNSSEITFKIRKQFSQNDRIVTQKIVNSYPVIVDFFNFLINGEINVINSSMILENGIVRKNADGLKFLKF